MHGLLPAVSIPLHRQRPWERHWIPPVMEAAIACILGRVVLAKSGQGMQDYILVAETYLTIGGMITMGKSVFEEAKSTANKNGI